MKKHNRVGAPKGAHVGSERWKIEQLKKGQSVVLFNRQAASVTGSVYRAGLTGKVTTRNAVVVLSRGQTLKGVAVTRVR